MKLIEAYDNREDFIAEVENVDYSEFMIKALKDFQNKTQFEGVLLSNFKWCVRKGLLEAWLPAKLPDCRELDCRRLGFKKLPELPRCEILHCSYNPIKKLPELPRVQFLDCSHTLIKVLPPLPECRRLCFNNTQVCRFPVLPKCEFIDCRETLMPKMFV